ncbi:hypothetical protein LIER_09480 [Lithospermum erythrorhizon]|uniref:Uncharacterized protein n=1 Tax=Lithospermum erythrorhizon TaxID=34254 RepID=A0AAV3PJP2_LITER
METKLHGNEWEHIKNKIKQPQALLVDAIGRRGGLALLWTRDLEILSYSIHHIELPSRKWGLNPRDY